MNPHSMNVRIESTENVRLCRNVSGKKCQMNSSHMLLSTFNTNVSSAIDSKFQKSRIMKNKKKITRCSNNYLIYLYFLFGGIMCVKSTFPSTENAFMTRRLLLKFIEFARFCLNMLGCCCATSTNRLR